MSAFPVPPLPLETIETIVDFLYDDRKTLIACSLASSKLLAASRYHLFSEVTLATVKVQQFVELVNAPWCSFANKVSRAVVTGDSSCKNMTLQMRLARRKALKAAGGPTSHFLPADLSQIQARLQNVKCVRFFELSPADIPVPLWRFLGTMKSVRTVDAHRFGLQCPLPFLEFVSSLPHLETLSISRPTITIPANRLSIVQKRICEKGTDDVINTLLPQREVGVGAASLKVPLLDLRRTSQIPTLDQSLDTCTVAGITVLQWLMAQNPNVPMVRTMRINVDYEHEMSELLSRYFVAAGSNIQKLCVALPSSLAALENMPAIDFSPLKHLQHLHIEGLYISQTTNEHLLGLFLRQFFSQIFLSSSDSSTSPFADAYPPPALSPPLVSKITITLTADAKSELSFFGLPDHAVLQDFGWFRLPDIIEKALEPFSHALDKLEVQLRVRSTGIVSENEIAFSERLVREGVWKGFEERGKLQVDFIPMPDRDGDKFDLP